MSGPCGGGVRYGGGSRRDWSRGAAEVPTRLARRRIADHALRGPILGVVGVVGGGRGATGASVYAALRHGFAGGRPQAYAYLLFVLLYLPCVATFGAMTREMGVRYSLLAAGSIGIVAWSAATLFYQLAASRSPLWTGVALALPSLLALGLHLLGRRAADAPARRLGPLVAGEARDAG